MTTNSRDTFANEARPRRNYGDAAQLTLDGAGSNNRFAYIWFPYPFAQSDEVLKVDSASLKVRLKGSWGGSNTITAKRITEGWREAKLNWSNKPTVTATNSSDEVVTGGSDGDLVTIDVTDMIQDVASGEVWHGIRLQVDTASARSLYSSEARGVRNHPSLDVEYCAGADEPDSLYPASDLAVGSDKPLLTWDFSSVTPDTTQSYSQVVISLTEDDLDDAIYEYDSTMVANTLLHWNLADTAYAGIPDGETRWWKVRVRDDCSGLTTEYSDNASFKYVALGTVEITDPDVTEEVDDTTPVISHTFTATQQSAAYYLYLASDMETPIYTRKKEADTELDFEIPEGYVTEEAVDFVITIRVWDDEPRADSVYATDSTTFHWTNPMTADDPTDVTAESIGPKVRVSWERSSEPDSYAIVEGGVINTETIIDGADAHVTGTSYQYDFYTFDPGSTHTFTLAAKTDGAGWSDYIASDTNPLTFTTMGIWLVDPTTLTEVHILGDENANVSLGQDMEVFTLLNRQDPVAIVSNTRGYEGSISGTLIAFEGVTAAQWKGRMEDIMSGTVAISKNLRLIFGRKNIPVIIGNFQLSELPNSEEIYSVSFDFYQVGSFTVEG